MKHRKHITELNSASKNARKPLSPEELVEARHDRIHREIGKSRAAKSIKVRIKK